jgi:hypothetical protein
MFVSVKIITAPTRRNSILVDIENISFEDNLVTQMNKTSIPPRKIRNRMYEYQNLWCKSPRLLILVLFVIVILVLLLVGIYLCEYGS